MKTFIKKWWFTLVCFISALLIVVFGIIYLFTDYSNFLYLTHITSGICIPVALLIIVGFASLDKENKND